MPLTVGMVMVLQWEWSWRLKLATITGEDGSTLGLPFIQQWLKRRYHKLVSGPS